MGTYVQGAVCHFAQQAESERLGVFFFKREGNLLIVWFHSVTLAKSASPNGNVAMSALQLFKSLYNNNGIVFMD